MKEKGSTDLIYSSATFPGNSRGNVLHGLLRRPADGIVYLKIGVVSHKIRAVPFRLYFYAGPAAPGDKPQPGVKGLILLFGPEEIHLPSRQMGTQLFHCFSPQPFPAEFRPHRHRSEQGRFLCHGDGHLTIVLILHILRVYACNFYRFK